MKALVLALAIVAAHAMEADACLAAVEAVQTTLTPR